MTAKKTHYSLALPFIVLLSLLLQSCEETIPEYYQCITSSGRGGATKNYLVYIAQPQTLVNPGLILLASCEDAESGRASVEINGNRYDVPEITRGLNTKVVIPLSPDHLVNGINQIDYYSDAEEGKYRVHDSRITSVNETSARILGQTYRILGREVPKTLANFDYVMNYKGEGKRKESDFPDWAQRGKIRYYRAGIDYDHLDRMFEMFKEAHINLVLLQVATPSDVTSEDYHRYKAFIDRCHENGIKVMYDGGSGSLPIRLNAITLEAVLEHPQWKEWISRDEYGLLRWRGRPGRIFLPDLSNEDYRKEVLKNTAIAVNAGCDEFYYDWAIGGTEDLVRFFTDVRTLTESMGKYVTIYANSHGHIIVNGVCDIDKSEGTAEPGIWPDGQWIHNVSQARFYYATGDGWKPYRSKYGGGRTPTLRDGMRACWQRPLAEASAFQSHFAIAETGNKLRDGWVLKNNDVALEIWNDICVYNTFFADYEELYTNVETVSEVGLLAPPLVPSFFVVLDREPIYDALVEMNVMYDVLLLPRITSEKLANYKTLVIPDLPWVTDEQLMLLKQYASNGGKIYTLGSYQDLQEIATEISDLSLVKDLKNSSARSEFGQKLRELTGVPLVSLKNSKYVLANTVRKKDTGKIIVHLVNYTDTVKNLRVQINLENVLDTVDESSITLFSPDMVPKELESVTLTGKILDVTIPELQIYNVLTIN